MKSPVKYISVVMSVYNGSKYLNYSIESILGQSYSNFEFIIVNDGSSDNTGKILNYYANTDNRVILLNNKINIGLTKSLNNAIKLSKGEYIARMDADDICYKNRFEEQVNILNKNNKIGITTNWIEIINENNQVMLTRKLPPSISLKKYFKKENLICHGSVMFRRHIFNELNGYNNNLKYAQDYDMWKRIFDKGYALYVIPKPLYKFRISNSNISIIEKSCNNFKVEKIDNINSKKLTWLSSLYLQQSKPKEANIILKKILFTKPDLFMKIIYYTISFFPKDFSQFIILFIKPYVKNIFRKCI